MQPHRNTLHFRKLLPFLAAVLTSIMVACGGSSSSTTELASSGANTGVVEDRLVTRPEATFTMDDLVSHGYKKSKSFDTETLGGASEAWYGFFNQRDIEVWVYGSHEEALNSGVPLAEKVITRDPGQTDYLIPVVNRYPAFAVAGNLIMLCERDLDTCKGLIDQLVIPALNTEAGRDRHR
ncbi:MAG: hypothetical protein O2788_03365 [Chloroflexi bacterium]|nr:hypothetical protein [Chloroflexota bacterium]